MTRMLNALIEAVHREAKRADFPVDTAVYQRSDKDPTRPILFAGSLDAPVCVFARDLGKDEVAAGEPLIGAGGRLVRAGLYEAWHGEPPPKSDRRIEGALELALLTNTVPFKPPGNKAYATSVKERFGPYADSDDFAAFWKREDRYEADLPCVITCETEKGPVQKPLTLSPLPHP